MAGQSRPVRSSRLTKVDLPASSTAKYRPVGATLPSSVRPSQTSVNLAALHSGHAEIDFTTGRGAIVSNPNPGLRGREIRRHIGIIGQVGGRAGRVEGQTLGVEGCGMDIQYRSVDSGLVEISQHMREHMVHEIEGESAVMQRIAGGSRAIVLVVHVIVVHRCQRRGRARIQSRLHGAVNVDAGKVPARAQRDHRIPICGIERQCLGGSPSASGHPWRRRKEDGNDIEGQQRIGDGAHLPGECRRVLAGGRVIVAERDRGRRGADGAGIGDGGPHYGHSEIRLLAAEIPVFPAMAR
jgi:hypothetical protein